MKKLLLTGVLTLTLVLAGCGQTQTTAPEKPADDGQAVQEPEASQTGASEDRNPTAAELDREETAKLTMSVEGETEEIPATLSIRQGYSIYIPDEGWQLETDHNDDGAIWEDQWESVHNDDVELGVRCYADMTAAEARERFARDEDDYLFEDLTGGELGDPLTGVDTDDNDVLSFMAAEKDGSAYVVYWKYPAEAAEGFGARLPVIAETFQLS